MLYILLLPVIVLVVMLFIPDKYLPKPKPKRYRRRHHSEPRGLRWMEPNYKKRKKREERNSSKFSI